MRRNVKVTLKTEEQLEERIIRNRENALKAYYRKKRIKNAKGTRSKYGNEFDSFIDTRSKCERERKVRSCKECCRYGYCKGFEKNPYKEKAIDLFLNTRKE